MFSAGADMFPHREVFLRGEVAFSTHVDMFSTGEISMCGEVKCSSEVDVCPHGKILTPGDVPFSANDDMFQVGEISMRGEVELSAEFDMFPEGEIFACGEGATLSTVDASLAGSLWSQVFFLDVVTHCSCVFRNYGMREEFCNLVSRLEMFHGESCGRCGVIGAVSRCGSVS